MPYAVSRFCNLLFSVTFLYIYTDISFLSLTTWYSTSQENVIVFYQIYKICRAFPIPNHLLKWLWKYWTKLTQSWGLSGMFINLHLNSRSKFSISIFSSCNMKSVFYIRLILFSPIKLHIIQKCSWELLAHIIYTVTHTYRLFNWLFHVNVLIMSAMRSKTIIKKKQKKSRENIKIEII